MEENSIPPEKPSNPSPTPDFTPPVEPQPKVEIDPVVFANLPPEVQARLKQNQLKGKTEYQTPPVVGEVPKKKKKIKKKFPILGCLGGFLGMYIISIILGIFVLWLNKDNSTFLEQLNLFSDKALKDFILIAINWSFFPLAIIFFITSIVGIFIMVSAKKTEPEKKKKGIKLLVVNLGILIVILPLWIGVYNWVNSFQVSAGGRIKAVIHVIPDDTSNLIAPTTLEFSTDYIEQIVARSNLVITERLWDFDGDKSFEINTNESTITQKFNSKGTFDVTVKITTNDNKSQEFTTKIVIPKAEFISSPNKGPAPLKVEFDASDITEGKNVKEYRWSSPEDSKFQFTVTDPNLVYTFTKIGTYNIKLETTDANGTVEVYQKEIEVTKGEFTELKPSMQVTPGLVGVVPCQFQFDASKSSSPSGKISKYEWNFGDGSNVKSGEKQNYVYKNIGEYTVSLTITDDQDERTTSTKILKCVEQSSIPKAIIKTSPRADEVSKIIKGTIPFTVNFDASNSTDKNNDITDYSWDLNGDGEFEKSGDKVTYIYREAGKYQVVLKVTDAENQTSEAIININVGAQSTKAIIVCDPSGCAGPIDLVVKFDATQSTASDGSEIVNYNWDFGDGSEAIQTGAITSHVYDKVGEYMLKLQITSATGLIANTTKKVFARVVPLKGCFITSRSSGPAPLTVGLDPSCSTGTIKTWQWSFGDGIISDARKPTHTFQTPGKYTVSLEVTAPNKTVDKYNLVINVE